MDVSDLRRLDLSELEALYTSERTVTVPEGVFVGTNLAWLERPRSQHRAIRPALWLLFGLVPYGVDFDRSRWFFLSKRSPRIGRFDPVVGRSRWRDTETVRLHYERSRLPGPVRSMLYDEVKPLTSSTCLGIGGLNADRGQGEQFFFALERVG